ncbi:TetR/AcrR family transcriptional regulator [Curtobacterium sp. 18060]|uniref:TetR/AcrR family transcriptional regulator n=1 Tax=Curtobacterium sp. 18060 TaxID=2681408 RepID=UPI0013576AE5|nr:TetR/AcrR family transcriptional regulator [Curtobacterium sp. 18060]
MPRKLEQSFHVGLTPDRVVDVAVKLTRESHLASWSIRDLAGRLDVAPSVIYHHVGGKDLLSRSVVERFLQQIRLPPEDLPWQDWFRGALVNVATLATETPGVAKWILMHGPVIATAQPVLEAGLRVLANGGFGDRVNAALAVLLNNTMMSVSLGDDRRQHEDDGPRDHVTMMTDFSQEGASERLQSMRDDFVGAFAAGGAVAREARRAYLALVVETTIAGLESVLRPSA